MENLKNDDKLSSLISVYMILVTKGYIFWQLAT